MTLNPINLLTGAFSTATGFLGGIQTYLIVGVVCVAVAGAGGWYAGSTHEAKIMANAAVQAADIAKKSQSDKDSKDWTVAKKDYDTRHSLDLAANDTLANLLAKKPKVIYVAGKAPNGSPVQVPAIATESMKSLNDPALVGETQ